MSLCKECNKKPKAPGRSRCYSCYGKARRGGPKRCTVHGTEMKILFIDIETKPAKAYTWSFWNANIGIDQVIEPGGMICFAASWNGNEDVEFYSEWGDGYLTMVEQAHRLLDEADAVVHFYGSRFDVPHLNTAFLKDGFPPPKPFKQIDLKMAVSKQFKLDSNKLQFVSRILGLEGKEEHEGFRLWSKVMDGDEDAQGRMESYNIRDVTLLKEVYEILLPWIPGHPSRHLYDGAGDCPTCGAAGPLEDAGFAYTRLSKFPQYRCADCGGVFRSSRRVDGVRIQESVL